MPVLIILRLYLSNSSHHPCQWFSCNNLRIVKSTNSRSAKHNKYLHLDHLLRGLQGHRILCCNSHRSSHRQTLRLLILLLHNVRNNRDNIFYLLILLTLFFIKRYISFLDSTVIFNSSPFSALRSHLQDIITIDHIRPSIKSSLCLNTSNECLSIENNSPALIIAAICYYSSFYNNCSLNQNHLNIRQSNHFLTTASTTSALLSFRLANLSSRRARWK